MTKSLAILIDSLRELRSRSLFWVSLGISAVVAIALFGLISFNEEGWRVLWFATNESETLRAGEPGARDLMSWMFNGVFVFWWLSWGAIILAVITTASMLPDFLADGSIDLALAKPISRIRLFLLKVLGALLFVALQTAVAVVLAWLLLGVKVDMWLHATLWAIPLIVVQFFYLYSVSALVAVITRSTLASLLVTVLFWIVVSLLQFASNQVDSIVAQNEAMLAGMQERIDVIEARAEADGGRGLNPLEQQIVDGQRARMQPFQQQVGWFKPYQRPLAIAELTVPKTGDVQKMIANLSQAPTFNELLQSFGGGMTAGIKPPEFTDEEWQEALQAGTAGAQAIRSVENAKSLGSSLVFSGLLLCAAMVLFVRKDF